MIPEKHNEICKRKQNKIICKVFVNIAGARLNTFEKQYNMYNIAPRIEKKKQLSHFLLHVIMPTQNNKIKKKKTYGNI